MSGGSRFYSDIYNHSIEYMNSIKFANFIDLSDHTTQHGPKSEYNNRIQYSNGIFNRLRCLPSLHIISVCFDT